MKKLHICGMRLYQRILLGLLALLGVACSDPDPEEEGGNGDYIYSYGVIPARYELKQKAEEVKNDSVYLEPIPGEEIPAEVVVDSTYSE